MTETSTSVTEQRRGIPGAWALPALALVLFYLYVWLRVDIGLLYFWPGMALPSFSLTRVFLADLLRQAGGPVQYAGAFLFQLYYFPWLGALVLTVVVGVQCTATGACIRLGSGRAPRLLHLVPVPLVLVLCNQYAHHLDMLLALAVAASAAWLCVRLAAGRAGRRVAVFLVLGGLVYYAAAGGFLVYAAMCGAVALARRRLWDAAACLAVGAALPFVAATWLLPFRLREAYGALLPFHPYADPTATAVATALCAFLPISVLAAGLTGLLAGRARPPAFVRRLLPASARPIAAAAAFALAAVVCVQLTFNGARRSRLVVERCARTEAWEELVSEARKMAETGYDLSVSWHVNRALCKTGRLADEMFSFPQHPFGLLPGTRAFAETGGEDIASLCYSDVFTLVGRVNDAAWKGYQVLELYGDRPWILERLVLLELARGQTAAARVLLGALSKDVIYGRSAREHLARLAADPSADGDPRVTALRSMMPTEDTIGLFTYEAMFQGLLKVNARNRAAHEYLMAHYLLSGRLRDAVQALSHLKGLGSDMLPPDYRLPRHYGEAVLLYASATSDRVDVAGLQVDEATQRSFRDFHQTLSRYGGNANAAMRELAEQHGDSYFLYYTYTYGGPGGGR